MTFIWKIGHWKIILVLRHLMSRWFDTQAVNSNPSIEINLVICAFVHSLHQTWHLAEARDFGDKKSYCLFDLSIE